jgi:catechol 2,3-dioxygenase-like lactoylglutathione lyase family enzyme
MDLLQSRFVTDDVAALASFYGRLTSSDPPLNDYYVEVPTNGMSVGFSKRRFTEYGQSCVPSDDRFPLAGESILDFRVDDVDREFLRIDQLGVEWILRPTTQPWGARAMTLRDPEGHLVNIFAPLDNS